MRWKPCEGCNPISQIGDVILFVVSMYVHVLSRYRSYRDVPPVRGAEGRGRALARRWDELYIDALDLCFRNMPIPTRERSNPWSHGYRSEGLIKGYLLEVGRKTKCAQDKNKSSAYQCNACPDDLACSEHPHSDNKPAAEAADTAPKYTPSGSLSQNYLLVGIFGDDH